MHAGSLNVTVTQTGLLDELCSGYTSWWNVPANTPGHAGAAAHELSAPFTLSWVGSEPLIEPVKVMTPGTHEGIGPGYRCR